MIRKIIVTIGLQLDIGSTHSESFKLWNLHLLNNDILDDLIKVSAALVSRLLLFEDFMEQVVMLTMMPLTNPSPLPSISWKFAVSAGFSFSRFHTTWHTHTRTKGWHLKNLIDHLADLVFCRLRFAHQVKHWGCHILQFVPATNQSRKKFSCHNSLITVLFCFWRRLYWWLLSVNKVVVLTMVFFLCIRPGEDSVSVCVVKSKSPE